MMKRMFLRSWLACLAVGLGGSAGSLFAQTATYTFSPVNQHDINLTAAYWNPIIQYVFEKSGIKLNLKIGRTSADTTSYVLAREVEFVFTNHLFSPEREQLGWKVFGRRQTPPVHGEIVVPEDSPIKDLGQLKGQELAFAGPEAFLVYKVPFAHLLSKGIEVKPVFAGNQTAAFVQLFSGKVPASGGNSQLVDAYERREGKKFRVLWKSEPFLDLALMASSKVPDKDVKAVANAFFDMGRDPKGKEILHDVSKTIGLAQDAYFIPASNADYAAYRRFYQSAPIALH
jgi:phosphonate transport system substrate-binding protein